jgi:hypothetical protein
MGVGGVGIGVVRAGSGCSGVVLATTGDGASTVVDVVVGVGGDVVVGGEDADVVVVVGTAVRGVRVRWPLRIPCTTGRWDATDGLDPSKATSSPTRRMITTARLNQRCWRTRDQLSVTLRRMVTFRP